MATKILNLDKLPKVRPARELVLNGKAHTLLPMTVKNFAITTRDAEQLEKEKAGMADQMDATIAMVIRSIPTLTTEELQALELETLARIAAFVRGHDEDTTTEDADPQEAADAAGKQ